MIIRTLALALFTATLFACQTAPRPEIADPAMLPAEANVVEVIAEDYAFAAPDEIRSGWTTFRLSNAGQETHFVYLSRLPEGRSFDEYVQQIGVPINEVWYQLREGAITKAEVGEILGATLPEWMWTGVRAKGGPGLVAPGGVAQATVLLEPGDYVMECFMKTPEGELHWMEGMIRPLRVIAAGNGVPEPSADLQVTITTEGFQAPRTVTPGMHRVEVHFADQPDAGFGNDVHVVRLSEGMQAPDLVPWMDFMNPQGLENPAPAAFIGGTQERPEGERAYFALNLEPGRYAWIAETLDVYEMVQEFTVR